MPAPEWEDLDVFLQEDDFATAAIINLQGGVTRPVRGIFDDPSMTAKLGGYQRDDNNVMLTVKETDAVGVRIRDTVTVKHRAGDKTYDVMKTPEDDGTGMSVIVMLSAP